MDGQKNSRLRRSGTRLEVDANGRTVLVGLEESEQLTDGAVIAPLPSVPVAEENADATQARARS